MTRISLTLVSLCRVWLVAPLLGLLALTGCEQSAPKPAYPLPVTHMSIGNQTFELEMARDDNTRQTGLMRRDSMPADHGMIFTFADEAPRDFYMKNTRIPLDILYLDHTGKIISIGHMVPYDEQTTPSGGPMLWAIELNAGTAARVGVKVGDVLHVPQDAATAKE